MPTEIYLDSNATNPVLDSAVEAARHAMAQGFGNPSSTHLAGLRAKALLDGVRQRAARVLGAGSGRVMFNSGATEGIHTAVLSALVALRSRRQAGLPMGQWLVYGATEHKAVPEALQHWNQLLGLGLQLLALPVDSNGRHDLARLQTLVPDTALLCTMAANNETGVISDLAGIEAVLNTTHCPAGAPYWLVDGVQALGKLPLQLARTRIDYAPFSGHKLYAPKGVGLLYVRDGAPFTPLLVGGGQEAGQRSGTENVAGIAALGAVLAALEAGDTFHSMHTLAGWRDQLADSLRGAFPGLRFNTPFDKALPTTLNFSVPGLTSQRLLNLFDAAGMRVSAGSACAAGKASASHVLQAMQVPASCSASAVRLSFGPLVDPATVQAAVAAIARCGRAVQGSPPLLHAASSPAPTVAASGPAAATGMLAAALTQLLQQQPDTAVVDVRDLQEHLAGDGLVVATRPAQCVPMAQLSQAADAWLQQPARPVVFICRSGQRALQAAAWLRGLGHLQAWHLDGGLAQLDMPPAPATPTPPPAGTLRNGLAAAAN